MIQHFWYDEAAEDIRERSFAEKPCGYPEIDSLLAEGDVFPRDEWLDEIGANGNGYVREEALPFFGGRAKEVLYDSEDDSFYVRGFIFRDHPWGFRGEEG